MVYIVLHNNCEFSDNPFFTKSEHSKTKSVLYPLTGTGEEVGGVQRSVNS